MDGKKDANEGQHGPKGKRKFNQHFDGDQGPNFYPRQQHHDSHYSGYGGQYEKSRDTWGQDDYYNYRPGGYYQQQRYDQYYDDQRYYEIAEDKYEQREVRDSGPQNKSQGQANKLPGIQYFQGKPIYAIDYDSDSIESEEVETP